MKSRLPRLALPRLLSNISTNPLQLLLSQFSAPTSLHTLLKMIRQDFARIDSKRRAVLDPKKKQFASPSYKQLDYEHRLNFYTQPPTAEITLEQFEQWAIDRLRSVCSEDQRLWYSIADHIAQYSRNSKRAPSAIKHPPKLRPISNLCCKSTFH